MSETKTIYHDTVVVPRNVMREMCALPFDELWDIADARGFEKRPHSSETHCAVSFALLRRWDAGKTALLFQNW